MLTGKSKIAGILGWPVSHTLSPRLQSYWLKQYNIDGAYIPMPVRPEHLREVLRAVPMMGLQGVNLTVPHKEEAMKIVDSVEESAWKIGAVNTITVDDRGRLIGSNTDAYGFIQSLREATDELKALAKNVVVIGAGGAARAVCAGLLDEGAERITITNRTIERAEELTKLDHGRIHVAPWEQRADILKDATMLINTTTLGMTGQPPLALNIDRLPAKALVVDIVYNPLQTELLKNATARGNRTVQGIGMLLHQARPGFKAWFGLEPEVTPALKDFVLRGI